MRLPGLVRYLCACVRASVYARAPARVCQSIREREREMRVGVCMCACECVGGGDMVYGCGVTADRMRTVIILVPSIYPINHI